MSYYLIQEAYTSETTAKLASFRNRSLTAWVRDGCIPDPHVSVIALTYRGPLQPSE